MPEASQRSPPCLREFAGNRRPDFESSRPADSYYCDASHTARRGKRKNRIAARHHETESNLISMQFATMALQPITCCLCRPAMGEHKPPEFRSMIHMHQMRNLMHRNIIQHETW